MWTSSIRVRSLSSKTWTLESTWTPGVSTLLLLSGDANRHLVHTWCVGVKAAPPSCSRCSDLCFWLSSVCIVGPNGVGKSTLLLLLTGKLTPVSLVMWHCVSYTNIYVCTTEVTVCLCFRLKVRWGRTIAWWVASVDFFTYWCPNFWMKALIVKTAYWFESFFKERKSFLKFFFTPAS